MGREGGKKSECNAKRIATTVSFNIVRSLTKKITRTCARICGS